MGKKLYVGNMNYDTTEDSLRSMFSNYGEVVSVNVVADKYTGRSRGFAFVEMDTDDSAKAAIESANGQELDGRALKVAEAREQKPRHDRYDR